MTKVTLAANQPPVVNAGPDQSISTPGPVTLAGTVADDGLPSGALSSFWTKTLGPGTVSFTAPSYDPAADLSPLLNPSGPWTFGFTPAGGSFTPFTIAGTTTGLPGWFRANPQTTASPGYYPYVAANKTVDMMAISASEFLPALALVITPGPNGQRGVVRWTAPAADAYHRIYLDTAIPIGAAGRWINGASRFLRRISPAGVEREPPGGWLPSGWSVKPEGRSPRRERLHRSS